MLKQKYSLKNYITVFLTALIVFSATGFALGAEKNPDHSTWKVEKIGVFEVPPNWQSIKFEEIFDQVGQYLQDTSIKNNKNSQSQMLQDTLLIMDMGKTSLYNILETENINVYQITVPTEEGYYTAWLMLNKNKQPMTPGEFLFFGEDAYEENRQRFAEHFTTIPEKAISSVFDSASTAKRKSNPIPPVEIFDQKPTKILTIQNAPAYSAEFRVLAKPFGLTVVNYVKVYCFNLDGHMANAWLLTDDVQRDFWNPVFSSVVESIK